MSVPYILLGLTPNSHKMAEFKAIWISAPDPDQCSEKTREYTWSKFLHGDQVYPVVGIILQWGKIHLFSLIPCRGLHCKLSDHSWDICSFLNYNGSTSTNGHVVGLWCCRGCRWYQIAQLQRSARQKPLIHLPLILNLNHTSHAQIMLLHRGYWHVRSASLSFDATSASSTTTLSFLTSLQQRILLCYPLNA